MHDFAGWRCPLVSLGPSRAFGLPLSFGIHRFIPHLSQYARGARLHGFVVYLPLASQMSSTCLRLVSSFSRSLSLSLPVSLWVRCFESPISPVCFRCRILFSVCLPRVLASQFLGSGRIVSGQRRLGKRWVCTVVSVTRLYGSEMSSWSSISLACLQSHQ